MSPLSWGVLAGTAVIGSPALWAAQVSGTLSPDVALTRLAICAAGVWAVCSLAAGLCERAVSANSRAAREEAPAPGLLTDEPTPEGSS